jgi:CBS domain-containing protein
MTVKDEDHRKPPAPAGAKPKPGDHFVDLMFSGLGHASRIPVPPHHRVSEEPYHPLRQSKATPHVTYYLRRQTSAGHVRPDSPATEVMTDLSRVAAVTTRAFATLDEAEQAMIAHGVRALFVVDDDRAVLGMITATDVLGERPIQLSQQRGIRHDEVIVREVMTPADRMEAMDFDDVQHARVGDVVATLRLSGRQHALVIEHAPAGAAGPAHMVRGIFSLTQIARQLGVPPQSAHDLERTFVAIEAALSS